MSTETILEAPPGMCLHGNFPEECQACNTAYEAEKDAAKERGLATRIYEVTRDKKRTPETINALIAIVKEEFALDPAMQNEFLNTLRKTQSPSLKSNKEKAA